MLKIIISKITALFLTILLPYWYFDFEFWQIILFFFLIHTGPGIMVCFFVAPAHFNTHLSYPIPEESNKIATSWSEHQLKTTEDFATNNPLLNFALGGFNHHVAHHLFPNICHIHYPKITPIIKQTAREFNLCYNCSPFLKLFTSHISHLKKLGKKEFKPD